MHGFSIRGPGAPASSVTVRYPGHGGPSLNAVNMACCPWSGWVLWDRRRGRPGSSRRYGAAAGGIQTAASPLLALCPSGNRPWWLILLAGLLSRCRGPGVDEGEGLAPQASATQESPATWVQHAHGCHPVYRKLFRLRRILSLQRGKVFATGKSFSKTEAPAHASTLGPEQLTTRVETRPRMCIKRANRSRKCHKSRCEAGMAGRASLKSQNATAQLPQALSRTTPVSPQVTGSARACGRRCRPSLPG
jgi:hypothetical protein